MSASVYCPPTRKSRPVEMALHRVERDVAVRGLLLDLRGVLLGLAGERDQEADDGERRLDLVLLEELPLQHLGALVGVGRGVLRAVAEIPDDRVRLGERAAVVEHERRHAPRRVQVAEHLGAVRAVDDAQLLELERDPEVRREQAHLVAIAGDRGVVEEHPSTLAQPPCCGRTGGCNALPICSDSDGNADAHPPHRPAHRTRRRRARADGRLGAGPHRPADRRRDEARDRDQDRQPRQGPRDAGAVRHLLLERREEGGRQDQVHRAVRGRLATRVRQGDGAEAHQGSGGDLRDDQARHEAPAHDQRAPRLHVPPRSGRSRPVRRRRRLVRGSAARRSASCSGGDGRPRRPTATARARGSGRRRSSARSA